MKLNLWQAQTESYLTRVLLGEYFFSSYRSILTQFYDSQWSNDFCVNDGMGMHAFHKEYTILAISAHGLGCYACLQNVRRSDSD